MADKTEAPNTQPNTMGSALGGGMASIVLQWLYPAVFPHGPAMTDEVAVAIPTLAIAGIHGLQVAVLNWRQARWTARNVSGSSAISQAAPAPSPPA